MKILRFAGIVPLIGLLAGCGSGAPSAKIGLNVELTGEMPAVGASAKNAAELFISQQNAAGAFRSVTRKSAGTRDRRQCGQGRPGRLRGQQAHRPGQCDRDGRAGCQRLRHSRLGNRRGAEVPDDFALVDESEDDDRRPPRASRRIMSSGRVSPTPSRPACWRSLSSTT